MASEPETLERLREALSELAASEVPGLVQEARDVARERVRELLTEALSESLLTAVQTELDRGTPQVARATSPGTEGDGAAVREGDGTAVYVYGVIAASDAGLPEVRAAGGEHGPVRAVVDGELAAIVTEVPLSDFDEARLREHLSDMTWVETTARHHEHVLEAIGAAATVVPMRMCTVYASEQGIRDLLRREAAPLRDALRYLAGKHEWGVKVFCDRDVAGEEETAVHERGESGSDYIQRRLRERDERSDSVQRVEDATARVHEQLCTVAADALLAPVQRPEVSGRTADMVLNGVYLVPVSAETRFHAQIRALGQEFASLGLQLELTGPWPAYNFVPGAIGAAW